MEIPAALAWRRDVPGGAEWLDRLPRLTAECAAEWQLRLGPALEGGNVSLVVAAERSDGRPAVLKINFPDALACPRRGGGEPHRLRRAAAHLATVARGPRFPAARNRSASLGRG